MPNKVYSLPAALGPWGLFFAAALAAPAALAAEVLTAEVTGVAAGDGPSAFEEAVANAQREGILQYIEANLPSGMSGLLNPILFKPQRYVAAQKVGAVRVRARMTEVDVGLVLNETKLRSDVANLVAPALSETASVFVLTGQRYGNEPYAHVADGYGQAGLESLVGELPVTLASPAEALPYWDPADLAAAWDGEEAQAASLGAFAFADVALVGRCSIQSRPAEDGVNLIENRVTLTVQVYDCRARDLIREFQSEAQVGSAAPETGIEQAVRDAVEKIRGLLLVETVFACARAGVDDRIRLTLEGLAEPDRYDAVTAWLEAQLGPEAVDAIRFHPDRSRIAVRYAGPVSTFVHAITGVSFDGFGLTVGPAVGREITLAAEPAP